jgi:hypothetical protein
MSPPRAPVTNIINEKEGNHSSETLELLSSDRNHMRKSWYEDMLYHSIFYQVEYSCIYVKVSYFLLLNYRARSALSIGKKLSSKINKLTEEVGP